MKGLSADSPPAPTCPTGRNRRYQTLIQPAGASAKAADFELAWFSGDGRKLERLPVPRGKLMQPRISPDGRNLAFVLAARGAADIWLLDFASGAMTQLTTDPGYDENAAWSPDGHSLAYDGSLGQDSGIVIAAVDGTRPPRVLVSGKGPSEPLFLPNRPALLFSNIGERGRNFGIARLDGSATSELTSQSEYIRQPAPSADGRWLAFVIERAGRVEVVLSPFVQDGTQLH